MLQLSRILQLKKHFVCLSLLGVLKVKLLVNLDVTIVNPTFKKFLLFLNFSLTKMLCFGPQ